MTRTPMTRTLTALALAGGLCAGAATPAAAATVSIAPPVTTTYVGAAGASAGQLAAALVGPGVSIAPASVTRTGTTAQLGAVHISDASVVSFNDGLIMSSGDIANIAGPNKSEGVTGIGDGNTDPDLTALISQSQTVLPYTFDAASLEFDFIPDKSTVYFTYVFGSDEYLEWVNLFNDVFGFFITPAGAGSATNCATVPDAAHPGQVLPVSIDSVNDTVNLDLYRDNGFAQPPTNPLSIEPDGLTIELICSATVVPGQLNHMKLAIADTSDQILDSFVLIKSGTLSTNKPESCNNGDDDDLDGLTDLVPGFEDTDCTSQTYVDASSATSGSAVVTGVGSGGLPAPFTGNPGPDTLPGAGITLDASIFGWTAGSNETFGAETTHIAWNVTGKTGGSAVGQTCTISPAYTTINLDGTIKPVTAYCPVPGEYKASVSGWEGLPPVPYTTSGATGDSDVDFWVTNAPPAVQIDSPTDIDAITAGDTVSLAAPVVDAVGDTLTCSISWGDGTSGPGTITDGQCAQDHEYAAAGQYLVSVSAADGAGATSGAAVIVTVGAASGQPQTLTVTTPAPDTAAYGTTFTVVTTDGESGNAAQYTASGGCTHAGATYTMTSGTTACQVGISIAGDATYAAVATTAVVAATKAGQTITWASMPPASAVFGRSFALSVTPSGSGNSVDYTTSAGCTNTGAMVTMTSGTTACAITVQQGVGANHGASNILSATVTAVKAGQSTIAVPTRIKKSKSASLAARSPQGLTVTVTVSGACKVAAVKSGATVLRWKVTAKRRKGTCTVRVRNAGSADYAALSQTATVKVR